MQLCMRVFLDPESERIGRELLRRSPPVTSWRCPGSERRFYIDEILDNCLCHFLLFPTKANRKHKMFKFWKVSWFFTKGVIFHWRVYSILFFVGHCGKWHSSIVRNKIMIRFVLFDKRSVGLDTPGMARVRRWTHSEMRSTDLLGCRAENSREWQKRPNRTEVNFEETAQETGMQTILVTPTDKYLPLEITLLQL